MTLRESYNLRTKSQTLYIMFDLFFLLLLIGSLVLVGGGRALWKKTRRTPSPPLKIEKRRRRFLDRRTATLHAHRTTTRPRDYQSYKIQGQNELEEYVQFIHPRKKNTPRRAALIIGINYTGEDYALEGCITDASEMTQLAKQNGFTEILVMTDDTPLKPINENIRKGFRWLVRGARQDDTLLLHFSGHGSTTREVELSDAPQDSTIVPLDWESAGMLDDNQLYNLIVRPLANSGAHLTVSFDCCHSGSALDLTFNYRISSTNPNQVVILPSEDHQPLNVDIMLLSGAIDSGVSNDVSDGVTVYGAMTRALVNALQKNPSLSCGGVLKQIQQRVTRESPDLEQHPQLSSERRLNFTAPFGLAPSSRSTTTIRS